MEDPKNKTKRVRCKTGTRWVEPAQKCMTPEEKQIYIANNKKNNTRRQKPQAEEKVAVAEEKAEEKVAVAEEKPEEKVEEKPSMFSNFVSIFTKPNNGLSKEDDAKKSEEKIEIKKPSLPDNILLHENQKRCPTNYIRHPPKSRNCTLTKKIKELENSKKTRKSRIIPKIQEHKEEKELSVVNEDISIIDPSSPPLEPVPVEEKPIPIEEPVPIEEEEPIPVEKEKPIPTEEEKPIPTEEYEELDPENSFLYPDLSDPNFSEKIYNKKEFNDYQYDGTIHDIREQSTKECNAPFEIMPHQQFVKNFLSMETPYNSLLLYHELGTGKTCSAIGITEDMRKYMKGVGNLKKIMIVASPNVQDNFKLQLFDPYKLQEIGRKGSGIWNLNSCVGNDLLKEINPNNNGMTREKITKEIEGLIRESYEFIGYQSLANYINNIASSSGLTDEDLDNDAEIEMNKKIDKQKIQRVFDNRMIVIDEVHNIIDKHDNNKEDMETKRASKMLLKLVKYCKQLRLLFLSGTPMYNSYKEIIWLINIMNINDQRSTIKANQVFNEDGSFVEAEEEGKESGKDILKRKLIGYVSYIRGENPYLFPYRIYPSNFASPEEQILLKPYPKKQMNGKVIDNPLKYIQVYSNNLGEYQQKVYSLLIQNILKNDPTFEEKITFGYTKIQEPVNALNMIYPNELLDDYLLGEKEEKEGEEKEEEKEEKKEGEGEEKEEKKEGEGEEKEGEKEEQKGGAPQQKRKPEIDNVFSEMLGIQGFNNTISYKSQDHPHYLAYDFEYKPTILKKYGRIFSEENIGKYSGKIAKICNIIRNSKGIILIYSRFIPGGLIPMALALEEMGFSRYGEANYTKSLFKNKPVPDVNPFTLKPDPPGSNTGFIARYVMITGDKHYSPNNNADLKLVTDISNKHGEHVRVVLISEAGSEGLDFKNIRQVHILEPWYNMNRLEQVIGRAVRTKSHCSLPLKERNVEIYLHGSYINDEEETIDMYMYRLAEKKALLIGQVTRLLKETAVDCLLNINQTNFTEEKIGQTIPLELSTNSKQIEFSVGDKPFTNICDYMENCTYTCKGTTTDSSNSPPPPPELSQTYSQYFLQNNYTRIAKRLRQLFREKTVYTFENLIKEINILNPFPLEQIYYTISIFLNTKEWLVDKKGKKGYLIKRKDTYVFQPLELIDENASIFERTSSIQYKRKNIPIEIPKDPILSVVKNNTSNANTNNRSTTKNLWNSLQKIMDIVFSETSYIKPITQDMHWYHYAKLAYRICIHKHNIPVDICKKYVVYHYLDLSTIEDKLWFLMNLREEEEEEYTDMENTVFQYFQDKMNDTKKYILLNDKSQNNIYKEQNNNSWKLLTNVPENIEKWVQQSFDKKTHLVKHINRILPKLLDLKKNELHIGFINVFKENMEFKIKNLLNNRQNVGASCFQTNKKKLIEKINDLLEIVGRTTSSEKYTDDPVFKMSIIERPNLCLIYEFLLRYFSEKEEEEEEEEGVNQIWFLNPEQSVTSKIDSFIVISQTIRGQQEYILK